ARTWAGVVVGVTAAAGVGVTTGPCGPPTVPVLPVVVVVGPTVPDGAVVVVVGPTVPLVVVVVPPGCVDGVPGAAVGDVVAGAVPGVLQVMPPEGTWARDSMWPTRMSATWVMGSWTSNLTRTTSSAPDTSVGVTVGPGGGSTVLSKAPIARGLSPTLISARCGNGPGGMVMCVGILVSANRSWVFRIVCVVGGCPGGAGGVSVISSVVGLAASAGPR